MKGGEKQVDRVKWGVFDPRFFANSRIAVLISDKNQKLAFRATNIWLSGSLMKLLTNLRIRDPQDGALLKE